MTLIPLYYTQPFLEVMGAHPSAALSVTVDDIQITAMGGSDHVVRTMVDAAGDMLGTISIDLHCAVKRAEAAVGASDRVVAKRHRAALRGLAAIEVLGCDYTADARRATQDRAPVQGMRVSTAL